MTAVVLSYRNNCKMSEHFCCDHCMIRQPQTGKQSLKIQADTMPVIIHFKKEEDKIKEGTQKNINEKKYLHPPDDSFTRELSSSNANFLDMEIKMQYENGPMHISENTKKERKWKKIFVHNGLLHRRRDVKENRRTRKSIEIEKKNKEDGIENFQINKTVLKKIEQHSNLFNPINKIVQSQGCRIKRIGDCLQGKANSEIIVSVINKEKMIPLEKMDSEQIEHCVEESEEVGPSEKSRNIILNEVCSNFDDIEEEKQLILAQYEKYKNLKKLKRSSCNVFQKSVLYSTHRCSQVVNALNHANTNFCFYQREVEDYQSVIWNLQNIVFMERDKYTELKEMLKYTTEEIEKENNRLYNELNAYKTKYDSLKKQISDNGYQISVESEKKESIEHKNSNEKVLNSTTYGNGSVKGENKDGSFAHVNNNFTFLNNGICDQYMSQDKMNYPLLKI